MCFLPKVMTLISLMSILIVPFIAKTEKSILEKLGEKTGINYEVEVSKRKF